MIEFKLSQEDIKQLDKEVANFGVILGALHKHKEIDFCISSASVMTSTKNRGKALDNC